MAERRNTIQLDAVRNAIQDAGRPLSIDEILIEASRQVKTLGLRTVYRIIRKLEDQNEITAVTLTSQPDRYELTSVAEHHHHHFLCNKCDRLYDIPGCPGRLEKMLPDGFVLQEHELTLKGLCNACA